MADMGCRLCLSYNRGAGTKQCFKCARYKEICSQFTDRETIRVIHLPSALMEEVADRSHMGKGLLWAIRKLDPRDAAVMLMRHYGEYTNAEIAEALNVSDRTITTIMAQATSTLKIILNEGSSVVSSDIP